MPSSREEGIKGECTQPSVLQCRSIRYHNLMFFVPLAPRILHSRPNNSLSMRLLVVHLLTIYVKPESRLSKALIRSLPRHPSPIILTCSTRHPITALALAVVPGVPSHIRAGQSRCISSSVDTSARLFFSFSLSRGPFFLSWKTNALVILIEDHHPCQVQLLSWLSYARSLA